jgi:hypothetical protein
MRRQRKRTAGYAARRLLKNARERNVRFKPKKASPSSSNPQCTAARSEKNCPTASKNELRLWPIEVDASAGTRQA